MSRSTIRLVLDRLHVRAVLDGKQTLVARPCAACEVEPPVHDGALVPVLKHGAGRVCSVRVHTVTRAPLDTVDLLAARAMGHRTTAAFRIAWMAAHDRKVERLSPDELDAFADDHAAVSSAWERWGGRDAWLIRFAYEPDLDERFIAKGVGHATEAGEQSNVARGYTTNPAMGLQHEPPAVDDATLYRYAEDARQRHAQRIADARSGDSDDELAMKLAALRTIARNKGVDISGDIKVLTDRINKIQRRLTREAA